MKKVVALIALMLVSACVGTTQPSKFYSLKTIDNADPVSNVKLNIGISEVKIPNYLDRPQIVTFGKDTVELTVSEINRWSEPLPTLLQRTVANDMSAYLPNSTVKPRSYSRESFDYTVYVELNRFDGTWGQKVTLEAWWNIINADNKVVASGKTEISRPLDKGYENLVIQDSSLIAELSRQIAEDVKKLRK